MTDSPSQTAVDRVACRRRIRRVVVTLVLGIALWLIASWTVAHRLTSRRRLPFPEPAPTSSMRTYTSDRLITRDGEELGAWFVANKEDRPSVLVLHGNGGSRTNCLDRAELLAAEGYSVLLISLRAHGDSTGNYNDLGYGARLDVVAAIEHLERKRPGKPIVILGTSLGAAAALFAAEELGDRVSGYILESPYRDLCTATWNRLDGVSPPGLSWIAYEGLLIASKAVLPHLDRISPYDAVRHVPADVPVLIIAGEKDRRARPSEARAIFEQVRDHGELVLFPNADHLRMLDSDPKKYREAVLGFMKRAATREP